MRRAGNMPQDRHLMTLIMLLMFGLNWQGLRQGQGPAPLLAGSTGEKVGLTGNAAGQLRHNDCGDTLKTRRAGRPR